MATKFKPKNSTDELLTFGVYFKSAKDISTEYLIKLCEGENDGNVLVKIYSTDITSNHFETDGLINGVEIGLYEHDIKWLCDVDLWGKYFFPKFNNEMQLYYDGLKYYGEKNSSDSITSLMECINYAIGYGLDKSGIKPY